MRNSKLMAPMRPRRPLEGQLAHTTIARRIPPGRGRPGTLSRVTMPVLEGPDLVREIVLDRQIAHFGVGAAESR